MKINECSVCHQNIGDLDVEKRTRHIIFCTNLRDSQLQAKVEDSSSSSNSTKKCHNSTNPKGGMVDVDTKKPATSRKISRNKLEQEFYKFTIEEQRKILECLTNSINSEVKPDVVVVKSSSKALHNTQQSYSTKLESELLNLRMELGEIINSEADLRVKEKRVRSNIKKLTRKVSLCEDQSAETMTEDNLLSVLFPSLRYSSYGCDPSTRCSGASSCPLWQLSKLCDLFDDKSATRVLNEERDAVIPSESDCVPSPKVAADNTIDLSIIGSTCVVQSQDAKGLNTEAMEETVESNDVIDLTLRSQPSPGVHHTPPVIAAATASSCRVCTSLEKSGPQGVSLFSQVVASVSVVDASRRFSQSSSSPNKSTSLLKLKEVLHGSGSSSKDGRSDTNIPSFKSLVTTSGEEFECSVEGLEAIRLWFEDFMTSSAKDDAVIAYPSCMQKLLALSIRLLSNPDISCTSEGRLLMHLLTELHRYLILAHNHLSSAAPTEERQWEEVDPEATLMSQGGFMMTQASTEGSELECVIAPRSTSKRSRDEEYLPSTPPFTQGQIVVLLSDVHPTSSSKKACYGDRETIAAPEEEQEDLRTLSSVGVIETETTPPCTQTSQGHGLDNPIELITPSPAVVTSASSFLAAMAPAADGLDDVAVDLTQMSASDLPAEEVPKQVAEVFNWGPDDFNYGEDFTNYSIAATTVDNIAGGLAGVSSVDPVPIAPAPLSSSARKAPQVVPNNENVVWNDQRATKAAARAAVTEEMTVEEALSVFIQGSTFYDDILTYKPIIIDKLKYEFTKTTNRTVTDARLLKYLDKEGAFVSSFRSGVAQFNPANPDFE